MEIHNKTSLWIGVILFNVGMFLEYFKGYNGIYIYLLMSLGVILMLFGFKKPKETKS